MFPLLPTVLTHSPLKKTPPGALIVGSVRGTVGAKVNTYFEICKFIFGEMYC